MFEEAVFKDRLSARCSLRAVVVIPIYFVLHNMVYYKSSLTSSFKITIDQQTTHQQPNLGEVIEFIICLSVILE